MSTHKIFSTTFKDSDSNVPKNAIRHIANTPKQKEQTDSLRRSPRGSANIASSPDKKSKIARRMPFVEKQAKIRSSKQMSSEKSEENDVQRKNIRRRSNRNKMVQQNVITANKKKTKAVKVKHNPVKTQATLTKLKSYKVEQKGGAILQHIMKKKANRASKAKKVKLHSGTCNEDNYEVKEIIDKRTGKQGMVEYLLVWKNYSPKENTWESSDNLNCDELLAQFESKYLA